MTSGVPVRYNDVNLVRTSDLEQVILNVEVFCCQRALEVLQLDSHICHTVIPSIDVNPGIETDFFRTDLADTITRSEGISLADVLKLAIGLKEVDRVINNGQVTSHGIDLFGICLEVGDNIVVVGLRIFLVRVQEDIAVLTSD